MAPRRPTAGSLLVAVSEKKFRIGIGAPSSWPMLMMASVMVSVVWVSAPFSVAVNVLAFETWLNVTTLAAWAASGRNAAATVASKTFRICGYSCVVSCDAWRDRDRAGRCQE